MSMSEHAKTREIYLFRIFHVTFRDTHGDLLKLIHATWTVHIVHTN